MGGDQPSDQSSGPLLDPRFEAETDRLTGTTIREGNTVELLPSGVTSYAKRWELIEAAQQSLHMVSFSFMKDDTTRRLRDTVVDKVRQGVGVKMIVDDAALYTTLSRGLLNDMAKAGAEIFTYNSPFFYVGLTANHPARRAVRNVKLLVKRRFHEKYLVADGRQAILGGMNWGTKYALGGSSPAAWRDSDVHLTGPVVADIQRRFVTDEFVYRALRSRKITRNRPLADPAGPLDVYRDEAAKYIAGDGRVYFPPLENTGYERIRYVGHKPWDEQRTPITNAVLQAIRTAEHSIYWGCHGIRPPRMVAENLADAVARGVEVHLITNSRKSSRSLMGHGLMGWMHWECSHHFHWLLEHGIHVYEWQRPGAFHSKNIVVDEKLAGIGSYNVATGSSFHHSESTVFVYGGEFPTTVRQQFDIDLQDCKEVTAAQARPPLRWFDPYRRPLHERNLLVDRSVWPAKVAADIDAGKVKWKYADPPPGVDRG